MEQSERRFLVHFERSQCEGCPLLINCPVTVQKKQAVLAFSQPLVMCFKALGCNIKRMVQYVLTSPKPDDSAFATPNLALC